MSRLSSLPYRAKNVEIASCVLYNHDKNFRDIQEIMLGIDIYHDIMDNGIYCEVSMMEAVGLVEFFPIVGDETLVLRFGTPGFDDFRTYVFRIFKVSDRKKAGERNEAYLLTGVSQEIINNERLSVKKSYKDLTADQITKSIYEEFLKPTEDEHYFIKKKEINLQESSNFLNLNFPGEKPITAINMAAREGIVKTGGNNNTYKFANKKIPPGGADNNEPLEDTSQASNFVFYESYDGWNFRTLDSLLVEEPFDKFFLSEASTEKPLMDGSQKVHPRQLIEDLRVVKQVDTEENIQNGLYSHDVEALDPILKRFTETTFNYDDDAKNFAHLEKKPNEKLYAKNSVFKTTTKSSYKYFLPTNIGDPRTVPYVKERVHDPFAKDPATETDQQLRNPRKLHEFLSFDVTSRTQLNNIVIEVTIPGNSDIEVGQVVELVIPQNTEVKEFMEKENLLYNKRFFVGAVRHVINKKDSSFFTVMDCVKDVYGKKVEEVTNA